MKKGIVLLLLAVFCLQAQEPDIHTIRSNSDYYWGEATAAVAAEAQDQALADMIKKIAVTVSTSFKDKTTETGGTIEEKVESILKTHSAATLKNVHFINRPKGMQIHSFAYMHKDELAKIYTARKQLAYELYKTALFHEQTTLNLAQALKLLYFSRLLLQSVPEAQIIVDDVNLTVSIPEKINDICRNIRFTPILDETIDERERCVTLEVTYKNQPVSLLDFMFWDGSNQVSVQTRDGQANVTLYGSSVSFDDVDISIKYNYYECRKEIDAVYQLWNVVVHPEFNTAMKISLSPKRTIKDIFKPEPVAGVRLIQPEPFTDLDIPMPKVATAVEIFQASLNEPENVETLFQDDPFLNTKMKNFLKYNHPAVLSQLVEADVRPHWHGYEVRRIPVTSTYETLNKQTTEYIVLDTDTSGQFMDLTTALNNHTYEQFVLGDSFIHEFMHRQTIIKFIEKYRTAYMTRDMDLIDKMFADNALIIVGRVIEEKPYMPDMPQYHKFGDQPDIEYLTMTKKEYLERQKTVFQGQSDILIEFTSFKIMKKQGTEYVYGVEMRQNYYSTTYSDEGHLFLLIDFNYKDPLIYVRAWQPQEWSPEQLVKAANYRIH
jgi:hypothetical protein